MNSLPDRNPNAFDRFIADTNERLAAGEIIRVSGLGCYCILAARSVITHADPSQMVVQMPSGAVHTYERRP